jgi:hypothetical protein
MVAVLVIASSRREETAGMSQAAHNNGIEHSPPPGAEDGIEAIGRGRNGND